MLGAAAKHLDPAEMSDGEVVPVSLHRSGLLSGPKWVLGRRLGSLRQVILGSLVRWEGAFSTAGGYKRPFWNPG